MKKFLLLVGVISILLLSSVVVLADPIAAPEPDCVVKVIETTSK